MILRSPRTASNFLRVLAVLQMLTGGIAIMPLEWIAWWHHWLGFGKLPDDATLRYVIRGGAFVQAAIGVLLWIIASDVIRYRPLVLAVGWIYLVSGPAFYLIDSMAGMPRFWSGLDAISCLAVGTLILRTCPRLTDEGGSPRADALRAHWLPARQDYDSVQDQERRARPTLPCPLVVWVPLTKPSGPGAAQFGDSPVENSTFLPYLRFRE